ncbi:MAG: putative sulfate exporter family transporter [Archaeoglobaceae archaeon]
MHWTVTAKLWKLWSLDKGSELRVFAFLLLLGSIGFSVNHIDPGLDALFVAFILGISAGSFLGKEVKESVNKLLRTLLPTSIALYGFNIYVPITSMELEKVAFTLLLASTIFASVFVISRKSGNSKELSILLSCGSGICGLSAIAIVSPIVKPKKEEFSTAIIAITVVGLLCTVLYPPLAKNLFPNKFYLLAGSTLPQTGLVKIATSVFGAEEVVKALSVKAIRIAMIAIVAFILSFLYSEKRFYVPWFIVAFVTTAFLSSYLGESASILKDASTILFASTLAGIGITVELRDIYRSGFKPVFATFCGMLISLTIFLLIFRGGVI